MSAALVNHREMILSHTLCVRRAGCHVSRLTARRGSVFQPSELVAINYACAEFYVDAAQDSLRQPHKALLFNKMKQHPVPVFFSPSLFLLPLCCVARRIETVIMLDAHFIVPSPACLCSL